MAEVLRGVQVGRARQGVGQGVGQGGGQGAVGGGQVKDCLKRERQWSKLDAFNRKNRIK